MVTAVAGSVTVVAKLVQLWLAESVQVTPKLVEGWSPQSLWVPVSYERVIVRGPLPAQVVSWVLEWGARVKVIEPPELIDRVRAELAGALALYPAEKPPKAEKKSKSR